jgi:hypothetical protein
MPELNALDFANTRPTRNPCDRLAEHYREIGISAVLAAFCIMSEPLLLKDAGISDERTTLPAVLRDGGFSD